MFVKKEGKWRLAITSVWFFVPILTFLINDIILTAFDLVTWLLLTAVCLCLAFLNPNKKHVGIVYAILAIIFVFTNYVYSKAAVFGAFSLSSAIDFLLLTICLGSLAVLGLAQFSDHPERWLKFRLVPTFSFAVFSVKITGSFLFIGGEFISLTPLIILSLFVNMIQMIAFTIGHHQLTMKFCEAARENMEEIADEENSSLRTEPEKKNRFNFKTVVKSAMLSMLVVAFALTVYNCAVAAFGNDPVVTVDGETHTIVKGAPQVATYPRLNKQECLDELNRKYPAGWPANLLSPEIATKYGVTILNDVFETWTYDNRVHLFLDADQWTWTVSGELETEDSNELPGEVVFDCTTGEVLQIYAKGPFSMESFGFFWDDILDELESLS